MLLFVVYSTKSPTCLERFLLGQSRVIGHDDVIDASLEKSSGQTLLLTQGITCVDDVRGVVIQGVHGFVGGVRVGDVHHVVRVEVGLRPRPRVKHASIRSLRLSYSPSLHKVHSVVVQSSVRASEVIRDVIVHDATDSCSFLKHRCRRSESNIKEQTLHLRAVSRRHCDGGAFSKKKNNQ
ncbi:hypothetical protein NP493_1248g00000 [Ridgeia piscesae]|uniref:Uncharacterized protein n=1 Tax=Ridgeia piscesae TaxID=27915 RepID=A0AAD9KBC0_RIDPI|nr:hypothetical protein NP493_1248g00000 [Ridgeia piscesae]